MEAGLSVLEEISPQAKDGGTWLGHCMFWKYFGDLNVKTIYRTNSIEYRTVKLMFYEAIFYIAFITLVTFFVVEYKSSAIYSAKQRELMYWSECDAQKVCALDDVTSHEKLYSWMRNTLIPKAFVYKDEYRAWNDTATKDYDLGESSIPWNPRWVSDTKTVALLGNIRIRQLRVKPNGLVSKGGCEPSEKLWKGGEFECYPRYTGGTGGRESKVTYADKWTPNKELYTWKDEAETNQIVMKGTMGEYQASGYFFDLPLSRQEALKRIDSLEEWYWLDVATRAVIVEFSVVNPNINIIINERLLFEFGPTGSLASHTVFPFRVATLSLPLLEADSRKLFMIQIWTLSFFILFFTYVLWVLYKSGAAFFGYLWNILDVLIIIFGFLFIETQKTVYETFTDVGPNGANPGFNPATLGRPDVFPPFSKIIAPVDACNNYLAFVTLFVWLRLLKYFTLVQSFRLLVRVLEKTVWDLVVFSTFLITIFFGFSIAFHVGFGHLKPFSSLYASFCSLFFILASSADISGLFDSTWLGEALYASYLILVYFLLFNMFMAVVIDTYSVATMLRRNFEQSDSPLWCFFVAYVNKLRGVSLVGKETEEEVGAQNEQFIKTALLPKPVAAKWEKKRAEMQLICQKSGYKVDTRQDVVSRIQLQRLMDENADITDMLGYTKALDVIREFTVPEYKDPYDQVNLLQEKVFKKIEELEKDGFRIDFTDVDRLKMVSQGLHNALTEIQNDWREELTCVLDVISQLSQQFLVITTKLEQIQSNHTRITQEVQALENQGQ